ncbi:MAG TPA: transglutaminase family protein [Trichocoleus sp.]
MRYQITHRLTYSYDRPVLLAPHTFCLRPRSDVTQTLQQFSLEITPEPGRISENLDLDGNAVLKSWFADAEVTELKIKATSVVETHRPNPFDYLLEPWATQLPIDYPTSLLQQLQPYLGGQYFGAAGIDPAVIQLAQTIWDEAGGSTTSFLSLLNQRIYETCQYSIRETGSALPAGLTWAKKAGSCRDYAVLLMEGCRAMGLAARFVSGYQEGDLNSTDRQLHAWAEVYLPGAGWRGYDPTHGLVVADRHIALVAMPSHRNTAPVSGSLRQANVQSQMKYHLTIQAA